MSVIVAVKENGVVYMGADSQTTTGKRKFTRLSEGFHKITRLKNGISHTHRTSAASTFRSDENFPQKADHQLEKTLIL